MYTAITIFTLQTILNHLTMKKYLMIGVLMLFSLIGCDPYYWMEDYEGYWFLKNTTDKPLVISYSSKQQTITPGDSTAILETYTVLGYNIVPSFRDIQVIDSICVYDTTGKELCKWRQENMDIRVRNAFNETLWSFWAYPGHSTWVYDICNEDFKQNQVL